MASTTLGSRPSHLMNIPNTKRHPNNTETDQVPFLEVITGLPRPYLHNYACPRARVNDGNTSVTHVLARELSFVRYDNCSYYLGRRCCIRISSCSQKNLDDTW